MAARVVDKLPEGDDWMYEVKFDGYRALLMKDGDNVRIRSRNDKDLTHLSVCCCRRSALKAKQAILDGELSPSTRMATPRFRRFNIEWPTHTT